MSGQSPQPRSIGGVLPLTPARASMEAPPMTATSPVISRRPQRGGPGAASPSADAFSNAGAADVRGSISALAASQLGRLSSVGPLAGGGGLATTSAASQEPDRYSRPGTGVAGGAEDFAGVGQYDPEEDDLEMEEVAAMPELPTGRLLLINCLTNWGDPNYIGLCGVEVIDKSGRVVHIAKNGAMSSPLSPQSGPRAVANLSGKGSNNTTDECAMWLVPFTKGESHAALLSFAEPVTIAAIRVWNYNHGRVHASRGARVVEITLDDVRVFRGELQCASGDAGAAVEATNCETLLFTEDERILTAVANTVSSLSAQAYDTVDSASTAAAVRASHVVGASMAFSGVESLAKSFVGGVPAAAKKETIACTTLSVDITASWGSEVVGLSGIRFFDANAEPITGVEVSLTAAADETGTEEGPSMTTPLDALFDEDPETAWFARLPIVGPATVAAPHATPGAALVITFTFPQRVQLAAIAVANAGIFDVACGVHTVSLRADGGNLLADKVVIRKAPALLPALLYQTIDLTGAAGSVSAASVPGAPAPLSASLTTRAAVSLRRAGMLQAPWPSWYTTAPQVPLLPVGYAFIISLKAVESASEEKHVEQNTDLTRSSLALAPRSLIGGGGAGGALPSVNGPMSGGLLAAAAAAANAGPGANASLSVHALQLISDENEILTPDFLCCSDSSVDPSTFPFSVSGAAAEDGGEGLTIFAVFEQVQCVQAVRLGTSTSTPSSAVSVSVVADDAAVYCAEWEAAQHMGGQVKTIPFTKNAGFLEAERARLI